MTSKKLVLDALGMCNHGRAPRQLWRLPWSESRYGAEIAALLRDYPEDLWGAPGFYREASPERGDRYAVGEYTDEWGCTFVGIQAGVIGEVKHPLVIDEGWADAGKVRIPYEELSLDIGKVNEYCKAHSDAFLLSACLARPFERLQFIRGTEQLFIDLMDPPPGLLRFLEKMHAFSCEAMEMWGKTEVDALYFMDDWGAQHNLLIPPRIWRRLFKPLYKDYIDIAHRCGKKAFMHSDGHTLAIYPDLIELGLDAFNSQLFCIGPENLAQYKGKITFWGEFDRQHLLPEGTTEEVRQGVRRVKELLWNQGGCIAQLEFGPGAKPQNVRTVFETWDELTAK